MLFEFMQNDVSFDERGGRFRDMFVLAVLFFFLYLGLSFMRPLASPDEGRYSEIPREMVASGDWVTPRLNGMPYFYKPPMFYWMQATSIKAFGLNRLALRFPNSAMAVFGILATYLAARALYGRRAGIFSAAVLGTSVLYFALGEIVTLDMTVSVFISSALFSFIVALRRSGVWRAVLILSFFLFCGLAVMTKGLIGVLIPFAVVFLYACCIGIPSFFKKLKTSDYLWSLVGLAIFAAVSVPWHVLCAIDNPPFDTAAGLFSKSEEGQGFFWYYIIHEHILRYVDASTSMREQPWWFFLVFSFVGMIPWVVFFPRAMSSAFSGGWKRVSEKNPEFIFFAVWAVFVVLFFSASKSKLVPYIIPIYPALSVFFGAWIAKVWENPSKYSLMPEKWISVALGFAGCIAPIPIYFILDAKGKLWEPTYVAACCSMLAAFMLIGNFAVLRIALKGGNREFFAGFFIVVCGLLMFFNPFGRFLQRPSTDPLAEKILAERADGDAVIVAYTYSLFQDLPVHLEELVLHIGPPPEEQKFGFMREREKNAGRFFETSAELKNFLSKNSGGAFILMADKDFGRFNKEMGVPVRKIANNGILGLYKYEKDAR